MMGSAAIVTSPGTATATWRVEDVLDPLYEAPVSFLPLDEVGEAGAGETFDGWNKRNSLLHNGPRGVVFAVREEVRPHGAPRRRIERPPGPEKAVLQPEGSRGPKWKSARSWLGGGRSAAKAAKESSASATGQGDDRSTASTPVSPPMSPDMSDFWAGVDPTASQLSCPSLAASSIDSEVDHRASMIGIAIYPGSGDEAEVPRGGGRAPVQQWSPSWAPSPLRSPTSSTFDPYAEQGAIGRIVPPSPTSFCDPYRSINIPSPNPSTRRSSSTFSASNTSSQKDGSSKDGNVQLRRCLAAVQKKLEIDVAYLLQVAKTPSLVARRQGGSGLDNKSVELVASTGLRPRTCPPPGGGTLIALIDVGVNMACATAKKGLYYRNPAMFPSMNKKLIKQAIRRQKKEDGNQLSGFPSGDCLARLQEAAQPGSGDTVIASGLILPVMEFEVKGREHVMVIGLFDRDVDRLWSVHDVDIAKRLVEKVLWTADASNPGS